MTATLFVKAYPIFLYDSPTALRAAYLNFTATEYYNQPSNWTVILIDTANPANPSATPFPKFPNTTDGINYYKATYAQMLVDSINAGAGTTVYTSYEVELVDAPVSALIDSLTLDTIMAGSVNKHFTATEEAKLSGIAANATANQTDSYLLNRANHTGAESADAITDGTTNKAYTATEKTKLAGIATGATANSSDAVLLNRANHTGTESADAIVDGSTNKVFTATEKTKLSGLAVQVQSDWNATTGLGVILNKPTITVAKAYQGTTMRAGSFPIFKQATVTSGVATFHLTDDGLSTGTALFTNGIIEESVNLLVNDATASYQMSYALTNSNKTLTVTANKLTTSNILTGVLGQAAANGSVVRLQVWGY